jgi:molecular chaperone GrpE (heat shock protein)
MLSWLLRRSSNGTAEPASAGGDETPGWAALLLERLQTAIRAQSKASLRLDELERKLEGGFERIEGRLARGADADADLGDLFDAADLLTEVIRTHSGRNPALAEGLAGVLDRLDRFFFAKKMQRMPAVGDIPDGASVRVVGTFSDPEVGPGAVTRVVRSAVLRGDTLIREGEVLVNLKSS